MSPKHRLKEQGISVGKSYPNWTLRDDGGYERHPYHDYRCSVFQQMFAGRTDRAEKWHVEITRVDYLDQHKSHAYPRFVERDSGYRENDVLTADEFDTVRDAMQWADGALRGLCNAPYEQVIERWEEPRTGHLHSVGSLLSETQQQHLRELRGSSKEYSVPESVPERGWLGRMSNVEMRQVASRAAEMGSVSECCPPPTRQRHLPLSRSRWIYHVHKCNLECGHSEVDPYAALDEYRVMRIRRHVSLQSDKNGSSDNLQYLCTKGHWNTASIAAWKIHSSREVTMLVRRLNSGLPIFMDRWLVGGGLLVVAAEIVQAVKWWPY